MEFFIKYMEKQRNQEADKNILRRVKMRAFLALFFITFSLVLNSNLYGNEQVKEYELTRVSITLEEKRDVHPDVLNMNLSVSVKTQRESEAINVLGSVDKSVRALNIDYSGGSYSVYKNCWWEKGKLKCLGYKGDLNYTFKLKEAKEQNRILETIEDIKDRYGEILSYTISNPQWIVSERKFKETENSLKLEIIDSAMELAKRAGEKIGRKCFISNIDYDIRRAYWESPVLLKSAITGIDSEKTIESPEPKREEKTVNVKAQVRFICVEKGLTDKK